MQRDNWLARSYLPSAANYDAMASIKVRGAPQKWSDVCFPDRAKQGSFARSLHGRIYGDPENKCAPRSNL
jgi:hypothetical protein